jgi:ankyrin repeat protein
MNVFAYGPGSKEVVRLLLEKGAVVDATNNYGVTYL